MELATCVISNNVDPEPDELATHHLGEATGQQDYVVNQECSMGITRQSRIVTHYLDGITHDRSFENDAKGWKIFRCMTIDPGLFMYEQRRFCGSLGATYPDRDFPMYLRWHAEGKFPLDRLVTRRYRLEQINEACDDLHHGRILGRAIIEY